MNKTGKIIMSCGAFVIAAGLGVTAYVCTRNDSDVPTYVFSETSSSADVAETPTEPQPVLPLYDEYVPSQNGITESAKIMLRQNKDYTGWLRIKNTYVNYPVLKDPGEISEGQPYYNNEFHNPNSFYLHNNFNRNYEFAGALFMDYRDNLGATDNDQSENIVIYGHNMLNLTMFGSLRSYYNDYSFWEKAAFMEFSTNYGDYDYVVCGNAVTSGYKESDFVYWDMEELDTEESFDFYMQKLKEKQLFDTGVDVKFGEKLLTLSTCYGASENNTRFILVARRLRDGEVAGDLSTIERTKEYKEKQKEKNKKES